MHAEEDVQFISWPLACAQKHVEPLQTFDRVAFYAWDYRDIVCI